MKLELGIIPIHEMKFSDKTVINGTCLEINKEELIAFIKEDPLITDVSLTIAKPGDKTRIISVKDVIEPRCKLEGSGAYFPGFFTGEEDTVGAGKTAVLRGAAVVTTGTVVGFQEGIIDMSGPGAEYTPFSRTVNLVVKGTVKDDTTRAVKEKSLRLMGLKTARYLGNAAKSAAPAETEVYETLNPIEQAKQYPNLPKVGYVYALQSQGLLHDTYYYGIDVKQIVPTIMYPTEAMDGAVVSGNCVSACDKNPTYVHQNSPVIHEQLGLDAVIISEEGFGNPDADLMMNCRKIAAKGIKTVLLTDEYAGQDGASQSLADAHPSADAVVSNGNANQVIKLPKMDLVIGDPKQANVIAGAWDGSLHEDGSIEAELQVITGATNELGFWKLSARGL